MVEPTPGTEGVYTVDTGLLGVPEFMSAYVIDADRPAVVDPGPATGSDRVLEALETAGIAPADVEYVIPTHVHLDHAGATGALADACENATIAVHERGIEYLTDPRRLERLVASARRALGEVADAYGDPDPVDPDRATAIGDGDRIDLGDRRLRVVHAPGHAPHQACLLDSHDDVLFAADAAGMWVFEELHPTTPPPDFDLAASLDTLDRLRTLEPERLLYGHYGARGDPDLALSAYADLLEEFVDEVRAVATELEAPDPDAVAQRLDGWSGPSVEGDVAGVLRYLDGN
jgi:glyoxylase-like metal-dependent hydrolase (beta-lactamase superfamily II)